MSIRSIYKKILPLNLRKQLWMGLRWPGQQLRNFYSTHAIKVVKIFYRWEKGTLFAPASSRKTILFYPYLPVDEYGHLAIKLCYVLGYEMSNDPAKPFHLFIEYEDSTIRKRDEEYLRILEGQGVVNLHCRDIGKSRIDRAFEKIFGYSVMVDPLTYRGKIVKKTERNAEHDGRILEGPLKSKESGFVYQRLINNACGKKEVYDIRVPILQDEIPYIFYKYRNVNDRFNHYTFSKLIENMDEVLSKEELVKIRAFCKEISMDLGELDILRDVDDGRLYIVDANNTPAGWRPLKSSVRDYYRSVKLLTDTFERNFIQNRGQTLKPAIPQILKFPKPPDRFALEAAKAL